MKKTIYTLIFGLCFVSLTKAQDINDEIDETKERKNAIGFSAGTGFGFDYSRKFSDKLYATLSYNSLVYDTKDYEAEISGETLLVDTGVDFKNIDIKLSYHPFSNAFKLVGGIGFFSSSNANVLAKFKDKISVGQVDFSTNDLGVIDIDFNWGKTAPYLGIGFGRPVSRKGLGFSFDVGTYFSSSPKITLDATGIIENTKDQEPLLNDTFESFKFVPYASFRLSYSF